MANLQEIVRLAGTQWNHMVEYGSVTVDGHVYYADENVIYIINDFDTFGPMIEYNDTVTQKDNIKRAVFNWSEVCKYKFIVIDGTHSAGRCNLLIPVSLIPYVADQYDSVGSLPAKDTNSTYRFTSRLYTSSATETSGLICASFAIATLGVSAPKQTITNLAIYLRNHTAANRNMRIYFIGRNEDVY